MENLEQLVQDGLNAVEKADNLQALDQIRVEYLGKKGVITQQAKTLGKLSAEERPAAGQKINEAKGQVEQQSAREVGQITSSKMRGSGNHLQLHAGHQQSSRRPWPGSRCLPRRRAAGKSGPRGAPA